MLREESPHPSVSVVIPTRNRANLLRECVRTVRDQDYGALLEIVVAEDGSTDGTGGMVRQFSKAAGAGAPVVAINIGGKGTNAAVNAGIRAARGEVIVVVGDDTLCPHGWLARLIGGLLDSGAEAVSGPLKIPISGPLVGRHREEAAPYLTEVLGPVHWGTDQVVPVAGNMAVWRRVFERGLFDETVRPPMEEVDWVLKCGVRAAFVLDAWAWHNKGPGDFHMKNLAPLAWRRGRERGWWLRARQHMPMTERRDLAGRMFTNTVRAFGHCARRRCWGGLLVGLGELASGLALVGVLERFRE